MKNDIWKIFGFVIQRFQGDGQEERRNVCPTAGRLTVVQLARLQRLSAHQ